MWPWPSAAWRWPVTPYAAPSQVITHSFQCRLATRLRGRRDIRQAEYNMAAAAAAIGVARKDFLPVISVQGRIGYDSRRLKHLFDSRSLGYT